MAESMAESWGGGIADFLYLNLAWRISGESLQGPFSILGSILPFDASAELLGKVVTIRS
jgi:hypothetical protein